MQLEMQPITRQLISELDLLYGLYQLALDYGQKIKPDDDQATIWLAARDKILQRTDAASGETVRLLKQFELHHNIPANEKALVEEKRFLIADLGIKMNVADNKILKSMLVKMSQIRHELADQIERKNAIKAYIQAPMARSYVN
jgi:hypothetical protein